MNQWYGLPSVPIAIALLQALKMTVEWPPAVWPWCAIGIAVLWNVVLGTLLGYAVQPSAIGGIVYGLMASGLYSAVKAHVELAVK